MANKYVYTFSVWPDETWDIDPAIYTLFECFQHPVELEFTPQQFERFRSGLSHHGLTLREISRVPYVEPEILV